MGWRPPRRYDDVGVTPALVLGFGCGCTSNNRTPPRLWHYFPEPQKAPKAKTKHKRKGQARGGSLGVGRPIQQHNNNNNNNSRAKSRSAKHLAGLTSHFSGRRQRRLPLYEAGRQD